MLDDDATLSTLQAQIENANFMNFKNSQNNHDFVRILKMFINSKNEIRCREKNTDRMEISDANVLIQLGIVSRKQHCGLMLL